MASKNDRIKLALFRKLEEAKRTGDKESTIESAWNDAIRDWLSMEVGDHAVSFNHAVEGGAKTTDGVTTVHTDTTDFSVLLEAKRDIDLADPVSRSRPLAEAAHYCWQCLENGAHVPDAVVIADVDEIVVVSAKWLLPYVSDGKWGWAESSASAMQANDPLVDELASDKNLHTVHVEKALAEDGSRSETFDFDWFMRAVERAAKQTPPQRLKVDEDSLSRAFYEFQQTAFCGQPGPTHLQVQIFIKALLGDDDVQPDSAGKNTISVFHRNSKGKREADDYPPSNDGKAAFSTAAYEAYWLKWDRNHYSLDEQDKIRGMADTLLEDYARRFNGDFWTPKIWADEAHKMIERDLLPEMKRARLEAMGKPVTPETLAELPSDEDILSDLQSHPDYDWKQQYVVWDPACGTMNLTRDYKFRELYCSTLHQDELNIGKDYNPEATKFQYDFLNDEAPYKDICNTYAVAEKRRARDLTVMAAEAAGKDALAATEAGDSLLTHDGWKLPKALFDALKARKPIVFFANPPYGENSTGLGQQFKPGITTTGLRDHMLSDGMARATKELYCQFIYRVMLIAEAFGYTDDEKARFHFFFFSKVFLTSSHFSRFTDELTSMFRFVDGFMLNAGEFNGTSAAWGIIFSHWKLDKNAHQSEFTFHVKRSELDSANELDTTTICDWTAHRPDKSDLLSTITPFNRNDGHGAYVPCLASLGGIGVIDEVRNVGRDYLGTLNSKSSSIQYSGLQTGLYSAYACSGGGVYNLYPKNMLECMIIYATRKCSLNAIQGLEWVRDKDMLAKPSRSLYRIDGSDDGDPTEWGFDCVVYGMVTGAQAASRGLHVTCPDGSIITEVKNQFCWRSRQEQLAAIETLADSLKAGDPIRKPLMEEVKIHRGSLDSDRWFHTWLDKNKSSLSTEAVTLIDKADALIDLAREKSVEFMRNHRRDGGDNIKEFSPQAWDLGVNQAARILWGEKSTKGIKDDPVMKTARNEYEAAVNALGDKIYKAYCENAGF